MGKVEELGPHDNMTSKEVLEMALRNLDKFEKIVIIGVCDDDLTHMWSSAMTNKDALWLLSKHTHWILNGET